MAEKSSFFTSLNGDRKYKASDFAEYFGTFISNGIFPNPATNLQVITNSDMTLTLSPGVAWINGYMYHNTENLILTVDASDAALKRIDRLVLRCDYINREIKANIKKGEFSSNPVAPVLDRSANAYEICVAEMYIDNGAIAIQQNKITDTRLDDTLCGITTSLIDIDIDLLTKDLENDFFIWFEGVKGLLNEDVAGNLANKIGNLDVLQTESKGNLVDAVNEVFQSGVNAKESMVQAINSKKTVPNVSNLDTWDILSQRVNEIKEGSGNATKSDVLSGKTFTNSDGVEYTGIMANRGGAQTITPGTSNKVLNSGYYSGNLTVKGDSNLIAANIVSGKSIFGVSGSAPNAIKTKAGDTYKYLPNLTTGMYFTHTFSSPYNSASSPYPIFEIPSIATGALRLKMSLYRQSHGGNIKVAVIRDGSSVWTSGLVTIPSTSTQYTWDINVNFGDRIVISAGGSYSASYYARVSDVQIYYSL